MAAGLRERAEDVAQVWPRESGVLHAIAQGAAADAAETFEYYAGLADTFPFEQRATPIMGKFGLLVREPVGVVGAIIPWNGPLDLIKLKIAPGLLAGCTVRWMHGRA
jgi:acyl-CoA reductase-like NAD-dependent aldehyde dehydrogenase